MTSSSPSPASPVSPPPLPAPKRGVPGIATLFIAVGAAAVAGGATYVVCDFLGVRERARLEGKRVLLLKYTRSIARDEKVDRKDLAEASIRKDDAMALGCVVESENRNFVVGRRLRQSVYLGQWVQWEHVTSSLPRVSGTIGLGMVAITLELDPRTSPGALCRPGDRVNVLAEIQIEHRTPPQVFRIIRNVQVVATGSSTGVGPGDEAEPQANWSYRTAAIEVSPEVSLQLHRLLRLAKGGVRLEVLSPDEPFDPAKHGLINPDEPILKELAEPKRKE